MFTDKVMFKALMVLFLVGFLSSDVIVTGKQMRRTATLTKIAIFFFCTNVAHYIFKDCSDLKQSSVELQRLDDYSFSPSRMNWYLF